MKKEKDFARSIGKDVEVRLYKPINKTKEYVGILDSYDKDTVTLDFDNGEKMTFERSAIALIRLSFVF